MFFYLKLKCEINIIKGYVINLKGIVVLWVDLLIFNMFECLKVENKKCIC